MPLEDGIVSLLQADTTLTALVGTRIYPVQGPANQPVYPYLVYHKITARSENALDSSETREKLLQFDVWGSYSQIEAILTALRNILSCYSGLLANNVYVLSVFRGNELSSFDNDQQRNRGIVEYRFHFVEM